MNAEGLRERRAALLADTSLRGSAWCHRWSDEASAWAAALFDDVAVEGRAACLVAVGGFGRSSLAPGSDLDLLLLHDRRRDIGALADRIWYPIWDAGMSLDHSVRTLKEVRAAMDSDVKVALGLLDARLVAGDSALFASLVDEVATRWRSKLDRWVGDVWTLAAERHERFGDLAFLLEPDLKEARGGLRDLEQLRSLSTPIPALREGLVRRPVVLAAECLATVRVELQRRGPSTSNVLLLQDQDAVATALGHRDADALMAAVADAGRSIAWAAGDAWRQLQKSPTRDAREVPVEPGIVVRGGEIALGRGVDPALDLSLPFRLAAASAERDLPLAPGALERLARRTVVPPDEQWSPAVRQAFLRLLGSGKGAIAAVEALDQAGVWLRFLPEWEPVRNRPQRNAYHRFTVDRHLLEAVANAAALQSRVRRPDLLLLAALLHDIGKGRGGDHTRIGMALVPRIAFRMNLPAADCWVLVRLVENHLVLPDVATRRDLDDPATARLVARAVGDRDTLELLAALTEADSLATGPAAWGTWKARLVGRLVEQVSAVLSGRAPPDARQAAPNEAERELLAPRELSVRFDGDRLLVAAADQSGLLATVAGVLTLSGVNVRAATTISDEGTGMALLRFEVAPAFERLPDWSRFRTELATALAGDPADTERRLEERDARYSRYAPRISAYTPEVRVLFSASPDATIVEVRAPDRGPVLYRVARALAEAGLSITCALVSTLGAEAIDVFYVNPRIDSDERTAALRSSLVAALVPAQAVS